MAEGKGLAALIAQTQASFDSEFTPEEIAMLEERNAARRRTIGMTKGDYETEQYGEVDTSMGSFQSGLNRFARGALEGTAQHIRGGALLDQAAGDEGYIPADVEEYIADAAESGARQIDINPQQTGHGQTLAGAGGSAMSFMAPQVGAAGLGAVLGGTVGSLGGPAGTAAGAVRGAQWGGRLGSPITAYLGRNMMMKNLYDDYVETTGTEPTMEELQVMAEESKAGYLEALGPTAGMNKAFGAGKGFIKHALSTGMLEGTTEMIQEGISQGIVNKVAKEKLAYDEDRNLLAGVKEQASVGGQVGFIMGAAMSMLGARGRYKQRMYEEAIGDAAEEETLSVQQKATEQVNKEKQKVWAKNAAEREKVAKEGQKEAEKKKQSDIDAGIDAAVQNIPPEQRVQNAHKPLQTEAAKKVRAMRAKKQQEAKQAGVKPSPQREVANKVQDLPNVSPKIKAVEETKAEKAPVQTIDNPEVATVVEAIEEAKPTPVTPIESIPEVSVSPVKNAETVVQAIEAEKTKPVEEPQFDEETPDFELPTVKPINDEGAILIKDLDKVINSIKVDDPIAKAEALLKNRKISVPKLKKALDSMGIEYNSRERKPQLLNKYMLNSRKFNRTPSQNLNALANLVKAGDRLNGMTQKMQKEYNRIRQELHNVAFQTKFKDIQDTQERHEAADAYVEQRLEEVAYGEDQSAEAVEAAAEKKADDIIAALKAKGFKVTGDNEAVLLQKNAIPDSFVADKLPVSPNDVAEAKQKLEGTYTQTVTGANGQPRTMIRLTKGASLTVPWDKVASYAEAVADGSLGLRIIGGQKLGKDKFTLRFGKLTNPQTQLAQHPLKYVKGIVTENYVTKEDFMEQVAVPQEEFTAEDFGIEEETAAPPPQRPRRRPESVRDLENARARDEDIGADQAAEDAMAPITEGPLDKARRMVAQDPVKARVKLSAHPSRGGPQYDVLRDMAEQLGVDTVANETREDLADVLVLKIQQEMQGPVDAYEDFQADQGSAIREASGLDALPTMDAGDVQIDDFFGEPPGKPSEGPAPQTKSGVVDKLEDSQLYAIDYDKLSTEDRIKLSWRMLKDQNPTAKVAVLDTAYGPIDVLATEATKTRAGLHHTRVIRRWEDEVLANDEGALLEQHLKDGKSTWVLTSNIVSKEEAKRRQKEREADKLTNEINELEDEGIPFEDDMLYSTVNVKSIQEHNNRLARGGIVIQEMLSPKYEGRNHVAFLREALDAMSEAMPDGPEKFLVDKIRSLNLKVAVTETALPVFRNRNSMGEIIAESEVQGSYGLDGISLSYKLRDKSPARTAYVLIHEAVHAATHQALISDKAENARMLSLFNQVKKHRKDAPNDINSQIFDNMDELIVYAFTDYRVQRWLDTIPTVDPETGQQMSWLERFFSQVARILGLEPTKEHILNDVLQSGSRLFWDQSQQNAARDEVSKAIDDADIGDLVPEESSDYLYNTEQNRDVALENFLEGSKYKQAWYHYMTNAWEKVDLTKTELGLHLGTEKAAMHRKDAVRDMAEGRGKPIKQQDGLERFYINVKNPFVWKDIGHFNDPATLRKSLLDDKKAGKLSRNFSSKFWKDLKQAEAAYLESFLARPMMGFEERYSIFSTLVRKAFVDEGIDAIVYNNRVEDRGSDSIIMLNDKMIKAADSMAFDTTIDSIYADEAGQIPDQTAPVKDYTVANGKPVRVAMGGQTTGMPAVDVAKAKKLEAQFQKGAAKNGLSLTVLWDGKTTMPEGFQRKVIELVNDRNYVRLKGTRGWINLKTKEVILFPQNMSSVKDFEQTLRHEVIGHFSMEQLFGDNFNTFLGSMVKNKHWKPLIQEKMDTYNANRKPEDQIDELIAAKEVIANLAETGSNPNLFKRVVAWVRHQLRKLGLQSVSENDVVNYIRTAGVRFEEGTLPKADYYGPDVMDSYVADLLKGGMISDLNAIETKNTMRGVIDMLMSNKIADIDELSGTAWAKSIKPAWDRVSKSKYFNWYSHLQGLDYQKTYQYIRQLGLGISSNYDRRAASIFKGLKGLNADQKSTLQAYFTEAGAELPHDWGTAKEIGLANDAKQIIFQLGQELVDFEYLDPKTFAANADSYLPRMYLAFVIDPQKAAAIYGGGSKVSMQNYLKEIKLKMEEDGANASEIKEIQKALGMIDDPVMLATNSIAMVGRDVALLQMLEGISYASKSMGSKQWVTPKMRGLKLPGMVKAKDPMSILDEVERNRKNVLRYQHGQQKRETAKLYDMQEREARAALEDHDLQDADIKDYKYIESSRRNGALSGRWVRKEVYDDIRASYVAFASEDPGAFEALFGQYTGLTKANRIWKQTKTVWNAPTHARNFIGNFVNLDISTATSTPRLMKMVSEELMQFLEATANETPVSEMPYHWRVADKLGITETTFTAQEAQTALREWKRALKDSEDWTQALPNNKAAQFIADKLPFMTQNGMRMADIAGGLYQASETLFKVVKLRDTIQRYEAQMGVKLETLDPIQRDAIESMAVQDAQKWIFDYSAVPRAIRYLRNAPIGAPFISFAYLALPRMFEAAAKHPAKMIQYTAAPFVIGNIAAMLGAFPDDDDDWGRVKAKLPEYMKDRLHVMPMPWKDEYGNRTFVDMGYFVPFSPYIEAGRAYADKFVTNKKPDLPIWDPILNMGILSGPTPDLITAWKTGIDSFTGRPIIDPYGTPLDKTVDGLTYAWTMAAPTFLTEKGWAGKTYQMLFDANKNFNPRTGERKEDLISSQLRLIGVNTTSPNLKDARHTNLRYMKSEISKIKAAASRKVKQARAAGATVQEQAEIRKQYTDKIKLYRQNIMDYRKESR